MKPIGPDNMMALIQYTDGFIYTCKRADISASKKKCAVRYKDRRKYAARVLIFSANPTLLEGIERHIDNDSPYVVLKNLKYTGKKLTCAEILAATDGPDDETKLFINEEILPKCNEKDGSDYKFYLGETPTETDEVSLFFEAIGSLSILTMNENIDEGVDSLDIQTDKLTTAIIDVQIDKPTTASLPGVSTDHDSHTDPRHKQEAESLLLISTANENIDDGVDSINVQIDKSTTASLPAVSTDHDSHTDPRHKQEAESLLLISTANENIDDGVDSINVQIDKSTTASLPAVSTDHDSHTDPRHKQEAESLPLISAGNDNIDDVVDSIDVQIDELTTASLLAVPTDHDFYADLQHKQEAESLPLISVVNENIDDLVDSLCAQVDKSITACLSSKPAIKCIETVQYSLVRVPDSANSTLIENLSSIGNLLDQNDSAILKMLGNNTSNESLDPIVFESIIDAGSHDERLKSPESFQAYNPIMSSTVIASSTAQSISMNITEDVSNNNVNDDKDYELSESYGGDNEASLISSHNESGNSAVLKFHVPGRPFSAPDDSNMQVQCSSTSSQTKKYFCLYCNKLQTKLARHLENMHSNEEDVKKFIHLPKKNPERQKIISSLRKNGNHLFNSDSRFNDGSLIVCRRPNPRMKTDAKDFIACANCKGQYARSVVRHHWRRCTERVQSNERIVIVKGRAIMARVNAIADDAVRTHIFSYLREDSVVRSIRYDEAVILYANKQCNRLGMHHHQYQGIRAQIRLLGRFLVAIKEINNGITDFASIFTPKCYDSCIMASKVVAGFLPKTRTFKHPTVAFNIGTLLKHVGELLRSKYIKAEDEMHQKKVEDFLKLLNEDYGTAINRAVTETQSQNNRRKKVELPTAADITKLQDYLSAERKKHQKILARKFSDEAWHKLAGVLLVSLQLFNRRRAGEIERIYIEDFESQEGIDAIGNKELFESLSIEAQQLAKKYVRFMIRGKLGRGVPVLVPSHLLECMNLIKKFRREAKVPDENPYIFGLRCSDPARHKYLRACNLLREFASSCGAKVPSALRGTKLRKHIATQCINLNLSETQVSDLANFMGHHEKIHKDIYRQPIVERDIIKISKLLELAQGTTNGAESGRRAESDSEEEELLGDHSNGENMEFPPCGPVTDFIDVSAPSTRLTKMPTLSTKSTNVSAPSTSATKITPQRTNAKNYKRKISSTTLDTEIKRRRVSETRRPWNEAEKCTVLKAFQNYMEGKKLPSTSEILEVIAKNNCLANRTGPQVKTWLHNERKKRSL